MMYLNDNLSSNFIQLEQAVYHHAAQIQSSASDDFERLFFSHKRRKQLKFAEIEQKHYSGVKKLFK